MKENVSLSQTAYERIKKGILSLEFPPGTTLQERALAELLGVSRTPVREAIHTLMRENWLTVEARSHSRVREVLLKDIQELYEVRYIIESSALALLISRGLSRQCALLLDEQHKIMQAQPEARLRGEDPFEFIELDREFHSIIYKTLQNSRLRSIWNGISDEMVWYGMMAMITPERFAAVQEEHGAIIEGLKRNDPAAVAVAVKGHLDVTGARIQNIVENNRIVYIAMQGKYSPDRGIETI